MGWKRNQDDRKKLIKSSAKKIRQSLANMQLNFYIQKKMIDYPETYMEEIKKDIEGFSEQVDRNQ